MEFDDVEFLFDLPIPLGDTPEWAKDKLEITFQVAEFGYLLNLLNERYEELVMISNREPDNEEVKMDGLTTEIIRNRLHRLWQKKYGALTEDALAKKLANEAEEWLSGNE